MLWNKLITGNGVEDLGIYLVFLKEFKDNKQSKVDFYKEIAAKETVLSDISYTRLQ